MQTAQHEQTTGLL